MISLNKNAKIIILAGVFGIVSITGIILTNISSKPSMEINAYSDNGYSIETQEVITVAPTPSFESSNIVVHIKGEVLNPGVYELKQGSRLSDAIEAAGGYTDSALQDSVNLALILYDQDEIIIPSNAEPPKPTVNTVINNNVVRRPAASNQEVTQLSHDNKLNINIATSQQLQLLPGIGEKLSAAIVDYRNKNGDFITIEDIMKVAGIGDKRFNAIKEIICVK